VVGIDHCVPGPVGHVDVFLAGPEESGEVPTAVGAGVGREDAGERPVAETVVTRPVVGGDVADA
jgi:hypothetical protein